MEKLQEELKTAENELSQEREKEKGTIQNYWLTMMNHVVIGLKAALLDQEAKIAELKANKISNAKTFNNSDLKRYNNNGALSWEPFNRLCPGYSLSSMRARILQKSSYVWSLAGS